MLKSVTHYEVLEKLGEGGMGTVFKGRDVKLQRTVALKFLSPSLLDSPDARVRFVREGQALSLLNHPHIATVYEVDEADGAPFLALEYLPGGTLRDRVKSASSAGKYIAARDLVDWGAGLAEGLAHAHRNGVIHRDVKSSNIMFDAEGRIKLTDFGLAKVTADHDLSVPGNVAGTFAYMAPEQAHGFPADQRSDLFSLGVVLYETATGRLPFTGASPAEVVDKVAHSQPELTSTLRPDLPARFAEVVAKLLAKKPADRYQQASDVARDLRAISVPSGDIDSASTVTMPGVRPSWLRYRRRHLLGALVMALTCFALYLGLRGPVRQWLITRSLPGVKYVAVLPFRSIGGDPEQQAFSDGLTEILTNALTKHGELSVVPSSDARRIETAEQARREFGVNLVVYGSIQRRGDRVRLIITLIDAANRRQIDSQPIDGPGTRLFELEDAVITKVGDLLNLVINQPPESAFRAGAQTMPGAYDAYLRGRGYLYRFDKEGNLDRAQRQFNEAIRADPQFAAAYVGLADTYMRSYRIRKEPPLLVAARSAAERARTINPKLAGARISLGSALFASGEHAQAAAELETALQLDPQEPAVYRELGRLYWSGLGRFNDAETVFQKGIAARPGDWQSHAAAAGFYVNWQHFPEAERHYRKIIEITPDNQYGYSNLGGLLLRLGRRREAEPIMRKAIALYPTPGACTNLAALYMFEGRYKDAVPMAEKAASLVERQTPAEFRVWGNLGDAYWLSKAPPAKSTQAWRKAADVALTLVNRNPADHLTASLLAKYEAKLGDRPQALQHIASARRQAPSNPAVAYHAALVHALLGRTDDALRELGAAQQLQYPIEEARQAPELAPLRDDPRFQKIVSQTPKRN